MPRIIVITDQSPNQAKQAVLLDEQVSSVHLSTDHASAQLVERVAWAVNDAEHLEGVSAIRSTTGPERQTRRVAA